MLLSAQIQDAATVQATVQATVVKMASTLAKTSTEPNITNAGPKEGRYILRNSGQICLEGKEYFKISARQSFSFPVGLTMLA